MLGNLRGSAYATGHGCSQQRNCRFNLDDMGEYDVEALVGLTQRATGDARPFYLGHSSGGGALYTWLQRRPRAHHVLRGALLWMPSVFYTEPHSTILKIYHLLPEPLVRALWQVPGDILPRSRTTADIAWRMCRSGSPLRNFCEALFQLGVNINLDSTDMKRLPEIVSHSGCGLPTTAYAHYLQNIRAKRLQAFDFGREENLSKYGSERPPAYHVVNSTLPTAFFLGTRDRLVSFEKRLPEIVSHASCGLPTTTYAHYLQNIRAKRLQAFDFGREENLSKYGSERPPAYHVVNSTLPTAFFLGTRDRLVSFEEGMRQIRMIPSNVKKMVVPLEGYDHFHVLFDKNVHRLVHDKMLSFMSEL
ncbi:lysosomal acid lipase/cholesteryl ester hydrolase-like [Schistocerca serialis cubense]|uniref:lysosomal acid lipase/cholesteryl ester hydrolase-like n=1 Tax=Schistocerca serialis cubense TaxID=2023355 RepID=UPI00214E3A36|nr:lysosomal acid lipase/cholesteryl ester hydrolase-like [Schistocerca serialis cubense]